MKRVDLVNKIVLEFTEVENFASDSEVSTITFIKNGTLILSNTSDAFHEFCHFVECGEQDLFASNLNLVRNDFYSSLRECRVFCIERVLQKLGRRIIDNYDFEFTLSKYARFNAVLSREEETKSLTKIAEAIMAKAPENLKTQALEDVSEASNYRNEVWVTERLIRNVELVHKF